MKKSDGEMIFILDSRIEAIPDFLPALLCVFYSFFIFEIICLVLSIVFGFSNRSIIRRIKEMYRSSPANETHHW